MEKFILLKLSLLQVLANIWVNCVTQIGLTNFYSGIFPSSQTKALADPHSCQARALSDPHSSKTRALSDSHSSQARALSDSHF